MHVIKNDPDAVAWLEDNPPRGNEMSWRPPFFKLLDDSQYMGAGRSVIVAQCIILPIHIVDELVREHPAYWQKLYD